VIPLATFLVLVFMIEFDAIDSVNNLNIEYLIDVAFAFIVCLDSNAVISEVNFLVLMKEIYFH